MSKKTNLLVAVGVQCQGVWCGGSAKVAGGVQSLLQGYRKELKKAKNKTAQDKTRKDNKRQDKTRRGKTRQEHKVRKKTNLLVAGGVQCQDV